MHRAPTCRCAPWRDGGAAVSQLLPRRLKQLAKAGATRLLLPIGLTAALLAPPAGAASGEPPRAEDVARFLAETGPLCAGRPAAECVDSGWRFADRNGDGRLGLEEANAVRDAVQRWFLGAREDLPQQTNAGVAVGLLALQLVGVASLHGSYDTDGDGQLTRGEALADVTLDERPLPLLLQDRAAVDWPRFLDRLGMGAAVLNEVLPQAPARE